MKKRAKKSKARKHTRVTKHDHAMADPVVKHLVEDLKQQWRELPPEAKAARLKELRAKGCTKRGLADELGISESRVRTYLSPPGVGHLQAEFDLNDVDEATRALVERIATAIVNFIQAKDGVLETATKSSEVPVLFEKTRQCLKSSYADHPRPFRRRLGQDPAALFNQTKPERLDGGTESELDYKARWLAEFLATVTPTLMVWELALARAERLLTRHHPST